MAKWKIMIAINMANFFLAVLPSYSLGALTNANTTETNSYLLVKVCDEQGIPINGAKVYVRDIWINKSGAVCGLPGTWRKCITSDITGCIKILPQEMDASVVYPDITNCEKGYEVLFIAKKMAPMSIANSLKDFPSCVTMKHGIDVSLILHGKTAIGLPKIMLSKDSVNVLFEGTNLIEIDQVGDKTWSCTLGEGETYVIGWISEKIFGYQSEPFVASKNLDVTFSPGLPSTFEYVLTSPPENVQVFPANISLLIKTINNGTSTYLNWRKTEIVKKPGIVKIKGLASGVYQISGHPQKYSFEHPFLHDTREIILQPGLVNHFESIYPIIDRTTEKGDVVIEGTIYDSNLKPVPNKIVKLIPMDDNGQIFNLYYPPSVTDNNGKFKFLGVRPNMAANIKCGNAVGFLAKESLYENAYITSDFNIDTTAFSSSVNFRLPDITVCWRDKGKGKLADIKGKVIVVDLWATWCLPCRKTMPEFNILAEKYSWNKEIAFIALSLDLDHDVWKKTVEKCDWNSLRHGWFDREKNSFTFDKPLPYSLIIDGNGVIRSAGNGIDIESELNKIISP